MDTRWTTSAINFRASRPRYFTHPAFADLGGHLIRAEPHAGSGWLGPPLRLQYRSGPIVYLWERVRASNRGVVARLHVEGDRFRSGLPSVTDAVGRGPTELGHPIQHVAREERFGLPPSGRSRSQTRSDDQLVPKDRVLHARLSMVSRRLLPPPTPVVASSAVGSVIAWATMTPARSTPRCSFFRPRFPRFPYFAAAHSPSPTIDSPVLSTTR